MRWWVSWIQPTEDYRPIVYPPTDLIGWWCSGYDSDDNAVLCAALDAPTQLAAENIIKAYWPESGYQQDGWRFFDSKPDDWLPGERFQLPEWSEYEKEEAKP